MTKKIFNFWMLTLSLSLLTFTACSSDDKDDEDLAVTAAGTYDGTVDVKAGGESLGDPQDATIKITRIETNKVKMTLDDFVFGVIPVGTIEVKDIPLETVSGVTTIKETKETITLTGLQGASADVTVTGTVKDGKLKMNIAVSTEALPLPISVVFEGDKK